MLTFVIYPIVQVSLPKGYTSNSLQLCTQHVEELKIIHIMKKWLE